MCRKILLVYAHPYKNSKNQTLRDTICKGLARAGFSVVVSDLYAQGFHACAGPADLSSDLGFSGDFRKSQQRAHAQGAFSPDITSEQAKLKQADAVIFQFPMWYFGMPAILKGWFDRVLSKGFAYGQDMEYTSGGMGGKLASVVMTTAAPMCDYTEKGKHGRLAEILYPLLRCQLPYVGFKVAEPNVLYGVEGIGNQEFSIRAEALTSELVKSFTHFFTVTNEHPPT